MLRNSVGFTQFHLKNSASLCEVRGARCEVVWDRGGITSDNKTKANQNCY